MAIIRKFPWKCYKLTLTSELLPCIWSFRKTGMQVYTASFAGREAYGWIWPRLAAKDSLSCQTCRAEELFIHTDFPLEPIFYLGI